MSRLLKNIKKIISSLFDSSQSSVNNLVILKDGENNKNCTIANCYKYYYDERDDNIQGLKLFEIKINNNSILFNS